MDGYIPGTTSLLAAIDRPAKDNVIPDEEKLVP